MMKIVVHKFGDVEKEFTDYILRTVNDCYSRIEDLVVEFADLYLFERSSALDAYVRKEKESLGIKTSAFESSFFAVHDAWLGTPRIMVACDKMLGLPKIVGAGVLHHEVAHTVLHGSLDSYSFLLPESLIQSTVLPKQFALDILYLVSVAVKDYEVTRLLYENGFVEDQAAYCRFILEPSEEDREAWNLAQNNESARVLVLVSILKTVCCAAPLLKDMKYGDEIKESIVRAMSYLPSEWSACLVELLGTTSEFGQNTRENVKLFTERIIEELNLGGI